MIDNQREIVVINRRTVVGVQYDINRRISKKKSIQG